MYDVNTLADTLTLICRPTQLVSATVRWTFRWEERTCCTTTSLLCPTSPASTAAPASPTKAYAISIALIWDSVGQRWEIGDQKACCLCEIHFDVHINLAVCLLESSASLLCGQCNRDWESGQRLHLSVYCGSLWHQESEHGVLPAFHHRWLTHRYGLNLHLYIYLVSALKIQICLLEFTNHCHIKEVEK